MSDEKPLSTARLLISMTIGIGLFVFGVFGLYWLLVIVERPVKVIALMVPGFCLATGFVILSEDRKAWKARREKGIVPYDRP